MTRFTRNSLKTPLVELFAGDGARKKRRLNEHTPLPWLPDEVWFAILTHTNPGAVFSLRLVCVGWRDYLDEERIVKALYRYFFGSTPLPQPESGSGLQLTSDYARIFKSNPPYARHVYKQFQSHLNEVRNIFGSDFLPPPSEIDANAILQEIATRASFVARRGYYGCLVEIAQTCSLWRSSGFLSESDVSLIWNGWNNDKRLGLTYETNPLFLASLNGHLEIVRMLLALKYVKVDTFGPSSKSALYGACFSGRTEVARELLLAGAKVDSCPRLDGITPLMIACFHGHADVADLLLDWEADVTLKKPDGADVLYTTVRKGHVRVLEVLCRKRPDLLSSQTVNATVVGGTTLLYVASHGSKLSMVRHLCAIFSADPNARNEDGSTAMYIAAHNGDVPTMRHLLSLGAAVDLARYDGMCPLTVAIQEKKSEAVDYLLSLPNIDLSQTRSDGAHLEYIAARTGDPLILTAVWHALKSRNTPLRFSEPRHDGVHALLVCSQNGFTDVVRLLLEEGANPSATNQQGIAPLHLSAQWGHLGVVAALCDFRPNDTDFVNQPGPQDVGSLFLASQQGHLEVVRFLLARGANIRQTRADGSTPLHVATAWRRKDVVRLLLQNGANPDFAKADGMTSRHIARQLKLSYFPRKRLR